MTNLRKDYIWNTLGTSANSFISLLLSIVVTRINGIDANGIFGFCFGYAILFFTIGLYGGRIYQVSDVKGEFESRAYIFLKFLTSVLMLITATLFMLINRYDSERVFLLLSLVLYKILDAIADPLYGVMQRQKSLYFAGISMTFKAVIGFIAFVVIDLVTHNIIYASMCLLAANAVFIVIYDIPHTKRLEHIGHLIRGNIKPGLILLKTSLYICSFAFLTTLLVNIPRYYVDATCTEEQLGIFNNLIMPATMLNLFVTFVIQPKLLSLSERFTAAEYESFHRTVSKLIFLSLGFGVIAIFAAWLIGAPVLSLIYGVDLIPFRIGLTLVVIGGTINTVTMIYSQMLSVMRRFKIQLFSYLVTTASVFIASDALVTRHSIDGAFWAFVIGNTVQAALFFISYRVIFRNLSN